MESLESAETFRPSAFSIDLDSETREVSDREVLDAKVFLQAHEPSSEMGERATTLWQPNNHDPIEAAKKALLATIQHAATLLSEEGGIRTLTINCSHPGHIGGAYMRAHLPQEYFERMLFSDSDVKAALEAASGRLKISFCGLPRPGWTGLSHAGEWSRLDSYGISVQLTQEENAEGAV